MSYKYSPPDSTTPSATRSDIIVEFDRWRDQADDRKVIGVADFPPAAKIGSAEARIRFELRGRPVELACSTWPTYAVNFRCLYLTIREMRLAEARGIGETMREAYAQLPAPPKYRDPYDVVGVRPDADMQDIEDMYRIKAQRLHPDKGGKPEAMAELNAAIERIRDDRKKDK